MSDEEHEIFQDKRDERDSLLKEWRDMLDLLESSSNILPNKDLRTIMMLKHGISIALFYQPPLTHKTK